MLRNRNFLLLWSAQCISGAGDTFTFLALAVRIDSIYPDPGLSARALGSILIAFALPQLLVGIFAGTLVDRWDRRWIMVTSDAMRALLVPFFIFLGESSDLPWAFGVAFTVSIFSVFFYPARTALLPSLVERKELMSANGWMQVGQTIARLVGPVLGGIAVGHWGAGIAFLIDAGSFLMSATLLLGISGVVTRAVPELRKPAGTVLGDLSDSPIMMRAVREEFHRTSPKDELIAGLGFAMRSRLLQGITIGLSVVMLGLGAVNVLFVPFLRSAFDVSPEGLGGIMTAQGAGMLFGGFLVGALGDRLSPRLVSIISLTILGASVAVFGMAPGYGAALAIIPFAGLAVPPINAALQTLMQRGVPEAMLGRADAAADMAISLANLIAMGMAGWLGDQLGLRQTFLLGGGVMIVGAMAMGALLGKAEITMPESAGAPAGNMEFEDER